MGKKYKVLATLITGHGNNKHRKDAIVEADKLINVNELVAGKFIEEVKEAAPAKETTTNTKEAK